MVRGGDNLDDDLRCIYLQRRGPEANVNFSSDYAVNDRRYLRFDHATVIEFDNVEGADLDVFDHAFRGQIPAMRGVYKWKRRPISKGASVTLRSTLD